jgi:hypothetical protein
MMICVICGKRPAGSNYIDVSNIGQVAITITLHMIDEHWDIVERIRATKGNFVKRTVLVKELASELYPST